MLLPAREYMQHRIQIYVVSRSPYPLAPEHCECRTAHALLHVEGFRCPGNCRFVLLFADTSIRRRNHMQDFRALLIMRYQVSDPDNPHQL
jgi:hypothetical protein